MHEVDERERPLHEEEVCPSAEVADSVCIKFICWNKMQRRDKEKYGRSEQVNEWDHEEVYFIHTSTTRELRTIQFSWSVSALA